MNASSTREYSENLKLTLYFETRQSLSCTSRSKKTSKKKIAIKKNTTERERLKTLDH